MPNELRFDFIAIFDTAEQTHPFDLSVPALLLGPLPDNIEITSRVMLATQDDLRQRTCAFALLSSGDFSTGDKEPEAVWNALLARWMREVESSPALSPELPDHIVQKLARLQWDVRSRTLLLGMWPSAMEAWDWIRTEFNPKAFPGDAPVPVRVWSSAAGQPS